MPDKFKMEYTKKQVKDQVAENPNRINRHKKTTDMFLQESATKGKRNYRWTSLENQYVKRTNRLTAEVDKARAERSDFDPLYSSFNVKGVFVPPQSVLHVLQNHLDQQKSSVTKSIGTKKLRTNTAFIGEATLVGSEGKNASLFARVGTVGGASPSKIRSRSFKTSADSGIRSAAFKQ